MKPIPTSHKKKGSSRSASTSVSATAVHSLGRARRTTISTAVRYDAMAEVLPGPKVRRCANPGFASTAADGSSARSLCRATVGPCAAVADVTRRTTRRMSSSPRTKTIGSGSAEDEANERPRVDMESNRGCRWVCVPHDRSHRRHLVVGVEQPCFVAMTTEDRDGLTLSAAFELCPSCYAELHDAIAK